MDSTSQKICGEKSFRVPSTTNAHLGSYSIKYGTKNACKCPLIEKNESSTGKTSKFWKVLHSGSGNQNTLSDHNG